MSNIKKLSKRFMKWISNFIIGVIALVILAALVVGGFQLLVLIKENFIHSAQVVMGLLVVWFCGQLGNDLRNDYKLWKNGGTDETSD